MSSIDVTEFVEAGKDQVSLFFSDLKQQSKFELGVSMCIYQWDALEIAVQNQWGGPQSADKRDWITAIVVELFEQKIVDVQLIEETMLYAMQDEFDVQVEDDSALPLAVLILKIYKEISQGQFETVDGMYAKWLERQKKKESSHYQVQIQEDPENPDDSDESAEDEEEQTLHDDVEMDLDDDHDHQARNAPIIDDDGFQLVQKKGRRDKRT